MTPVLIDVDRMEPGTRVELITSSNQEVAKDLPAAVTPDGYVVSRWKLSDEDRHLVESGADIYVFVRAGGKPLQPISLVVG